MYEGDGGVWSLLTKSHYSQEKDDGGEWSQRYNQRRYQRVLSALRASLPLDFPEVGVVEKELIASDYRKLDLKAYEKLISLQPDQMQLLTMLHKLDKGCSSGLVKLPAEIGLLQHLTSLKWECSWRMTSVPREIKYLSRLTELSFFECTGLERLPEEIGALKSLKELDLRGCQSLSSLPASIGKLTKLEELDLCECMSLTTLPEQISHIPALRALHLEGCSSFVSLPMGIKKLTWRGCTVTGLDEDLFLEGLPGACFAPCWGFWGGVLGTSR